jgi:F0F1-type ATP synthase assembly protein I
VPYAGTGGGPPRRHVGLQTTSQQRPSVSPQPDQPSPFGLAAEWVARLTMVGMEMVVFGLGGLWLDKHWATEPLFALVGFAVGIGIGIVHLLVMTAPGRKKGRRTGDSSPSEDTGRPSNTGRNESDRKEIDE